jgi:hypothetical protein
LVIVYNSFYILLYLVYFLEDFYIYVHKCYWPIVLFCFPGNLSAWFGIKVILTLENELGSFPICSCPLTGNWYNFFIKCLVEFTSEPTRAWCFLFQKAINYFFKSYWSIQIFYLLLCEFWQLVYFKKCVLWTSYTYMKQN